MFLIQICKIIKEMKRYLKVGDYIHLGNGVPLYLIYVSRRTKEIIATDINNKKHFHTFNDIKGAL